MHDFKTIEEKSTEWKISARYIQSLCRQGKIEGTIKRAGVWFIPQTAANPSKNKDQEEKYLKFRGTKQKIFEKAIELFAAKSYDSITIKDIADEVGIRQSAVYNHFKSKQEILDTIYDFYCCYYIADRPTLEELEPTLRNGTLLEIMGCVIYSFKDEYKDLLINISKIVLHRGFIDERAREIAKKYTVDEGVKFAESVFNRAIEIGRLKPFNAFAMSVFCNSVRLFIYHNWIIDPSVESFKKWASAEKALFEYATVFLKDLNQPTPEQTK